MENPVVRASLRIAIVTDIFGIQQAVADLAAVLRRQAEVVVLSPYDESSPIFASEEDAYAAFLGCCGHQGYLERITKELGGRAWTAVLGFSAGASALWRALAPAGGIVAGHFVGFYPTKIRDHIDQPPLLPTTLIFPRLETVVDVDMLIARLQCVGNVACIKTRHLHGFVNPASPNYCARAGREYLTLLGSPGLLGDVRRCRKELAAQARD